MYYAFRIYHWERPPLPSWHTMVHRGAGIGRPENTLESFKFSWSLGLAPEADLRMTKDNIIICFHDDEIDRVVANPPQKLKKVPVKDINYNTLKKLDVGSKFGKKYTGQRIPKLVDVFKAMQDHPDRYLYLDIKRVFLDNLEELVKEYKVADQVILTTNNYDVLRRWRIQMPGSKTMLWTKGNDAWLKNTMTTVRKHGFFGLTHFQLNISKIKGGKESFILSAKMIRKISKELRKYGIVPQAFPINLSAPEIYQELSKLGIISFGTDYPEEIVKFIDSKNDLSKLNAAH